VEKYYNPLLLAEGEYVSPMTKT